MSATPVKIWTRCPACRSRYHVIQAALGHAARCKRCRTYFRVEEYNAHPTEDDILRWLSEGSDQDDVPHQPRIISGRAGPLNKPASSPAVSPPMTAQRVVVQHVRARSG